MMVDIVIYAWMITETHKSQNGIYFYGFIKNRMCTFDPYPRFSVHWLHLMIFFLFVNTPVVVEDDGHCYICMDDHRNT